MYHEKIIKFSVYIILRCFFLIMPYATKIFAFCNKLIANPDNFQSIILSRNGGVCTPISVQNNDLCPPNEIKVLGVTLDDRLNFKSHVDDIYNRASRQINSFKRFSKYLIDRLTDHCQCTKVLFSPTLRTALWLGSYVVEK